MPISTYDEVDACSQRDPEGFWAAAADVIMWFRRWDRVFDDSPTKPLPGYDVRVVDEGGREVAAYPQGKT